MSREEEMEERPSPYVQVKHGGAASFVDVVGAQPGRQVALIMVISLISHRLASTTTELVAVPPQVLELEQELLQREQEEGLA
jgi:hypothetical protein